MQGTIFAWVLGALGVGLVVIGALAVVKLTQSKEAETDFTLGPLSIKTKSPALGLVVMGLAFLLSAQKMVGNADKTLPKDVVKSYLDLVAAYNEQDATAYYASFADPIDCFYDAPHVRMQDERKPPFSHLDVVPGDLSALEVKPDRVELCDRGHYTDAKGLRLQHHKIIVMRKQKDHWVVAVEVEVEGNQSECYPSQYASQC